MATALRILLSLLMIQLLCAAGALAGPSYWRAATSNPASDSWRDGITISFSLDENQCKKKYGEAWPQQCAAPALGEAGALENGIAMTPQAEGEWRWQSSSALRFIPKKRLAPGTNYQVKLSGLSLSPRIVLANTTLGYTTQPQAVSASGETFWIDPSSKGSHAVSLPLQFIWPVNPADIERRFRVAADNPSSGLAFGQPRFVWNEACDSVVVNLPVASLPRENATATATLSGMGSFFWKSGKRELQKQGARDMRASFKVTGQSAIMNVKQVSISGGYDEDLNHRYVVEIATSLHVKPEELLRHLEAIELPKRDAKEAGKDLDWTSLKFIDIADLQKGRKIELKLLSANDPSDKFRLSVNAEEGHCVCFRFSPGLAATSGHKLAGTRNFILSVPRLGHQAAFLQPGNILTLSGEKKLDLYARDVDAIAWKARRIRAPFFALMARQKGFSYTDADEEAGIESLSDTVAGTIPVKADKPDQACYPVLDLAPVLQNHDNDARGLMEIEIAGMKNGEQVASQSRLVLVSDLGLRVKKTASGDFVVFVQNQSTGEPVKDCAVSLLSRNGTAAAQAKTGADGRAELPAAGLANEREPVAVTAEAGGDLAWLSLKEPARKLDMSAFNVQGRHCVEDGLIASVFSQRGIYMPGETLHFGTVVRRFDWAPLPKGMPLEALLTSPAGSTVMRQTFEAGADGLAQLSWASPSDAPTGTYRLDVTLAGKGSDAPVLGSCETRIEEFEPDTLAMKTELSPKTPKGWIRTGQGAAPVSAKIRLTTLYGNEAAGHRVSASFVANPARLRFKGFEDYTFFDSTPPLSESATTELPDTSTAKDGSAEFALPLEGYRGTFQGSVHVEGFEAAGGRAISRNIDALYSPLACVLGWKPVDEANNLDYVSQNAKAALSFIALDNELNPIDLKDLAVTLSHRRYVNSLVVDSRGEYRYDAVPVDSVVSTSKATVAKDGVTIPLATGNAGDFLITVKDAGGTVLASIPYTVAGTSLKNPVEIGDDAELAKGDLRIKLDRKSYKPGDTISVRISAPFEGTGLVTIERDSVAAHAWFKANAGESVQTIAIPKHFEGKGYVCVSFVRGAASDAVYMKPHAYAAAPFLCGLEARDMGISIQAPDKVLPGETMKVKVKSKEKGRVLLFAVDEGILSLTRFATPKPLNDLLADRGLDVETMQAFDLLMPDHARLKGRIPAFGGDMDGMGGRFLNPFKRRSEPPFAIWNGIVDVSSQETEIDIPVPQYLAGQIRIMAVGSGENGGRLTAGSSEASTKVRGGIVLRPLLPLATAPGDAFEGAVIVANTIENSGPDAKVHLSIKASSTINLFGSKTEQDIAVPENAEEVVRFRVRVNDALGVGKIDFKASCGQSETLRSQELSIRPPVHRQRTESAKPLTGSTDIPVARSIYGFDAENTLTVSSAPLAAFRTVGEKLKGYPYGCTEQLISRAMPFAATAKNPRLRALLYQGYATPEKAKEAADKTMRQAISAIRANFEDGVALWPGSEADSFVTCYAADFLLTLRENGLGVPEDLANMVFESLDSIIARESKDMDDARVKAYACWLAMRNGSVMTSQVENLVRWLNENAPNWRTDVTAALVADCYAMLRMTEQSSTTMPSAIAKDGYDTYGFLSYGAAQAIYTSVRSRGNWERPGKAEIEDLLDQAFSEGSTTTVLGLTARALAGIPAGDAQPNGVSLSCQSYQDGFEGPKPEAVLQDGALVLASPMCTRFHVDAGSQGGGRWFWHLATEGYDREPAKRRSNGMEVSRRYLNSRGDAVTQVRSGDVLTVELTVRSNRELHNVAVVDLLPGGLEPILDPSARPEESDSLVRFERREDRAVFFVNTSSQPATYTYKVRAVTAGTYNIPSVTAEAMYKPELNAAFGGGTLEVTR
ncbi:MAG: hypothetical protein K6E40_09505 [Desulfovibrio sp.]|nr:hypothetical protein [Desulfovibrio sp.]